MNAKTLIFDPTAPSPSSDGSEPWHLESLAGKVVGFIDNAKPNFNHLVDALSEVLVAQHGVTKVVKARKSSASVPAEREALEGIVAEADLVITGSGD